MKSSLCVRQSTIIIKTLRTSYRYQYQYRHQHYHQNVKQTEKWIGRTLAEQIQHDLVEQLKPTLQYRINNVILRPGLAVIIVGDRRDSLRYVEKKIDAAKQLGYHSEVHKLPVTVDQSSLIHLIEKLNNHSSIDGILVQLPLPDHLDADRILASIDCDKDVDGLHPTNMGKLAVNYRNQSSNSLNWIQTHQFMNVMISNALSSTIPPNDAHPALLHIPCAARACFELLLHHSIDVKGKHCVLLGRSAIVGLPLNLILLQSHATVTNIDQYTPHDQMKTICRSADIIITAVGQAGLINRECVKPGVIILDVGINFVPLKHTDNCLSDVHSHIHEHDNLVNPKDVHDGVMLVGDVDFESCLGVASAISPVPGGIGPLTVAMLMENTALSFVQRFYKTVKISQ